MLRGSELDVRIGFTQRATACLIGQCPFDRIADTIIEVISIENRREAENRNKKRNKNGKLKAISHLWVFTMLAQHPFRERRNW
jgi:hypothetical protein